MKAYNPKKRLSAKQRELIRNEVAERFNDIQKGIELITQERATFMFLIALGEVATEQLHYGAERRERLIKGVIETANKISDALLENTCTDAEGKVDYDVEYNREILTRLANTYGVGFDESIFDDDYLEEIKNGI